MQNGRDAILPVPSAFFCCSALPPEMAVSGASRGQLTKCFSAGKADRSRPTSARIVEVASRGRLRKRYRQQDILTPYEQLKSLPGAKRFLRDGTDFAPLDAQAYQYSDNEALGRLKQARDSCSGCRATPWGT